MGADYAILLKPGLLTGSLGISGSVTVWENGVEASWVRSGPKCSTHAVVGLPQRESQDQKIPTGVRKHA